MGANALAFKTWAVKENVITTSFIAQFQGKRIGIDAEDYLHSLLITGNREPLLPALGGKPFCLWRRVDEDIEGYRAAGIEPFFVFNGLDLSCRDRLGILNEGRKASTVLNEAWQIYDQGKGEEAVNQFGKACTYRIYHIARSLQMYLHGKGVSVLTAPYAAAAQLVYLEQEGEIDAIQGSASCLMFGGDRVILSIDWDKDSAVWLDQKKCLAKLDVTDEQFVTACLLSGSGILPILPELDIESPVSKIQAARGLLKSINFEVDSLLRHKDGNYHTLFYQARFALRYPVVLKTDGKIEQLGEQSNRPSDAHDFIGQRLPDELYFYLARGLAGPRVLNARTRLELLETPPLDGGNSQSYKDLVQAKLRALRSQAVALLSHSLNRYYQRKEVMLLCWWHELAPTSLGTLDISEPTKGAETWHVKNAQITALSSNVAPSAPLAVAVSSLSNALEAKKTVTGRDASYSPLREVKEIQANIVWRFLQDRGYITSDHTLSPWGKALEVALTKGINGGDGSPTAAAVEQQEAIFMSFELLRLGILDKKQMFPVPPYSGGPIRGSDSDKAHIQLISRIACLGFLQHKAIGYTGPLSRNLLAYHQCTAAVRGALRDLLEMHACNMLLSGAVDRNLDETSYTDIAASLPLVDEPDIGLALIVKCHLDELCQSADKRVAIAGWFPHAVDIEGDLQKAWRLWDAVHAGVQAAEGNILNSDVKKMFQTADDWLKEKLELANAPNGTA